MSLTVLGKICADLSMIEHSNEIISRARSVPWLLPCCLCFTRQGGFFYGFDARENDTTRRTRHHERLQGTVAWRELSVLCAVSGFHDEFYLQGMIDQAEQAISENYNVKPSLRMLHLSKQQATTRDPLRLANCIPWAFWVFTIIVQTLRCPFPLRVIEVPDFRTLVVRRQLCLSFSTPLAVAMALLLLA